MSGGPASLETSPVNSGQAVAAAVLRRDRAVVLAGLAAVVAAAAGYTITMAQAYHSVTTAVLQHHHGPATPGAPGFIGLAGMWIVMQVAMMSPTAVPMVLMHVRVQRHRYPGQSPLGMTALFTAGYLVVWAAFSVILAGAQTLLQGQGWLSAPGAAAVPGLAGGILIAAGLFQFSALKAACLNACRSPVHYFMLEWREGPGGALRMGLQHGVHCVGCCWLLMALLFAAGVMNLLWMAVITAFVLAEKALPQGRRLAYAGGLLLILWGLVMIGLSYRF